MTSRLQQLRERVEELADLRNAAHLLEWDQQTMMPPRGAPARAESLATLERISHELFVSAETGRLLWTTRLGMQTAHARPASVNSFAVFVTSLNMLYALDRR